ncbi:uncharacterized protein N7482_007652 [Penicillium canariense]|uniref:Uncharacterized protein n=1 Tax=Penicillium canariense TaxID=189055 RepID=A0A9W9HZG7_9EURO|nr:uncharacterized protein N7482_007652 [Penicillium canariense]KAJ5160648.1 hypothetical protein N7482_007652 [Penicillium canariense]
MGPQPSATESQPAWRPSPGTIEPSHSQNVNTPQSESRSEGARQQRVEATTTKSDASPQHPRRFLAQPIETSSRSSQTRQLSSQLGSLGNVSDDRSERKSQQAGNHPRRFLPEPIESSRASNQGSVGPRRFKPELLETDHRSVKGTTADLADRQHIHTLPAKYGSESRIHMSGATPSLDFPLEASFGVPESKFSYASLLRRQEMRRHSFRVPDLPSIPSHSSEDSDSASETPPLSLSPARPYLKLNQTHQKDHLVREGNDDFSRYLLSLAARSAQKQLREQALAAFPNEQVYQPVDHFAVEEEDGVSEEDEDLIYPRTHHIKSRRQSSADLSWELDYMRQHKEEAEQRLRLMVASQNPGLSSPGPKPASESHGPSPPMLGADLVLPQSLSPDGTLCEELPAENKIQAKQDPCTDCGGLWCEGTQPDDVRGAGLWMGTCRKAEGLARGSQLMTGIMTPMIQCEEFNITPSPQPDAPMESEELQGQARQGTSPGLSRRTPVAEFHDGFVTQIYNYLSLGYPCVARYYDHELSKISGIALQDLRRDDLGADARGYVVPPVDNLAVACVRWKALRLYIHEWARQQPNMVEDETGLEAWGVPERRGSWAI